MNSELPHNMPYRDDDEYVSRIVEQCTQQTLQKQYNYTHSKQKWVIAASIVSIVGCSAVALSILFQRLDNIKEMTQDSPLDTFLAELPDNETSMLTDYYIDDIPEY